MSASLVGSEMCIRDRVLSPHPSSPATHDANSPTQVLWTPCRAHRHVPVSYTHLTLPTICSV
eukprot:6520957-Alexandrium_andersonii.AAC.1